MIYIFSCIPPLKWANLAAQADKKGPFKHQVRNPLNIVGGGGVLPFFYCLRLFNLALWETMKWNKDFLSLL